MGAASRTFCCGGWLLAASVAVCAAPLFAQDGVAPSPPPARIVEGLTVARQGAGIVISFAVDKPTDVTVRILAVDGKVVRHLVSGMVGLEKAAEGLKPNALAQDVVWDRKDDRGRDAGAGPFSVEVGAGLRAKFDRFLLDGHDTFLNEISAFGGSNRTGHVFTASPGIIDRASYIREFDREGKYVRTIWPPNPNMPKDLLDEFYQKLGGGIKDYDGNWVLAELHDNAQGAPPLSSLTETDDGRIIGTPSGRGAWRNWMFEVFDRYGRKIVRHKSAPWVKDADWAIDKGRPKPGDSLGIFSGADGKYVYVIDRGPAYPGMKPYGCVLGCFDAKTLEPVNRFHYAGLKKLDAPVYHLGTPNEPGTDEAHFSNLTGAAVDDKGRFWAGDANCLKVYDGEGKFLKHIDAATPGFEKVEFSWIRLGANTKAGGVYMATGGIERTSKARKLYKLESVENQRIVWETEIDRSRGHVFVDSEAGIIWVADGAGKLTLLRVEDKGGTFEKKVISGVVSGKLLRPQWLRTDAGGNLYVLDMGRNAIIKADVDGKPIGEIKTAVTSSDGNFALDAEGNLYIAEWSWHSPFRLRKFSPDGKLAKIGGRDALVFDKEASDWMTGKSYGRVKGVCVAANGDIYVAGAAPAGTGEPGKTGWVNVYAADGTLKKAKLIQMASPNDIQMGRDGLYTVEAGVPLSPNKRSWGVKNNKLWTLSNELQKFSLDGGVQSGEGHLWSHAGVGYVNTIGCGYECPGAQVCVDDDDRAWITEHSVFNVKAVDSAGNRIARFGSYGNADCDGEAKGLSPKPDIPLAWPQAVARHGDWLFIADRFNARIVRCRLEYAERRQAPIN